MSVIEFHDAVDELQHTAERNGLVAAVGQNAMPKPSENILSGEHENIAQRY
jgi:hypothetical protein